MSMTIQNLFQTVATMAQATNSNSLDHYHIFLRAILVEDEDLAIQILTDAKKQRKIQELVTLKTAEGNTPLSLALENGMLNLAMELVSFPEIPVFEKNRKGDNALMIAIRENYNDIVQGMLGREDLKKYLHEQNNEDDDAFMIAVRNKNFDLATALLKLGANLEGRDKKGNTRLMTAIMNLPHEYVEYLLSKGADINAKDMEGNTALITAVKNQDKYAVRYLCEQGASISVCDASGKSLAQIIKCQQESSETNAILDLVKTQHPRPKVPYNYKEIFIQALSKNDLDNFKYCISIINRDFLNLDIQVNGDQLWKPIHIAGCLGHLDLIKYMLEEDQNLAHEKDKKGNTVLHIAAASGQLEVVKYLIAADIDLLETNLLKEDALKMAQNNNRAEVAKFIRNELMERKKRKDRESLDNDLKLFDRDSFIEKFSKEDAEKETLEGLHLRGLAIIAHYFSMKGTPFFVVENELVFRHAVSLIKHAKNGTEYGLACRILGHNFAFKCEKYNGINHLIMMDGLGSDAVLPFALDVLGAFNYGMYIEAILPEVFQDVPPGKTYYYQNKEGRQTSSPVCSIFAVKDIRKMLLCKNLAQTLLQSGARKMPLRILTGKTISSRIPENTVLNYEYNTPDLFMRLAQSPDQFMKHIVKKRKQQLENRDSLRKDMPYDVRVMMHRIEMVSEYERSCRQDESNGELEKIYNINDSLDYVNKKMEFQSLSQYAMRPRNKYGVQTPEVIENINYHPVNNPNVPQFALKNKTIEYFRNKYIKIVEDALRKYSPEQLHLIVQAFNAKHLKLVFPQINAHNSDSAADSFGLLEYGEPAGIVLHPFREHLMMQINEMERRKKQESEWALMHLQYQQMMSSAQMNQPIQQVQPQGVKRARPPEKDTDKSDPMQKRVRV